MDKPKNILYLSYDGMTDPLGQSQVLPYIIGLTKEGYKFTLISCEKKVRFQKNKTKIEQICKDNNIDWHPIPYTKSPPIISTIWDIYQLNKKAKQLHKQKNFALFHCRSYITSLIGLGFKKKHNVKFLFDMRGFWADERVDGGIWDKQKFPYKQVYNYFKKKEREFLIHSDAVISLTEVAKKEMLTWGIKELAPQKITVIPTCADLKLFDYRKINHGEVVCLKRELGFSSEDYILTYLGSLGTWYLVGEMLMFYKVLLSYIPHCKFAVYTTDSPEIIYNKIDKLRINRDNVCVKYLTRQEVPLYVSISDLSISFIKPLYSKKASSPTKMGEILGLGIPLICNDKVGDVENIISGYKCGMLVSSFDNHSYEKVAKQIHKLKKISKSNCFETAEKVFSLEKGVDNFKNVYKLIVDGE